MSNREFFQQMWKSEMAGTIRALKALGDAEQFTYRPAEKNRTAKQLVDHFVTHAEDLIEGVETGVINHRVNAEYPSIADALATFERNSEKLMNILSDVDETTWNEKMVPMNVFGNKVDEGPLSAMCWMFLFDIIHHRGQLSTYYRPMGLTQPSIYGPTAEMVEAMMAKSAAQN